MVKPPRRAVLTPCCYSRRMDGVMLPEQPRIAHHTFCWAGEVGAALKFYQVSSRFMMLPRLLLLPAWPVAHGGEQTRRLKSTPYGKHILKGIVKGWGLEIQPKECEESCLDLIWVFIKCAFSFSQKCFAEGCPIEGRCDKVHFWGPRLLVSQGCKNLQFSKPKSGGFFILQVKNFAKYELWSLSKDGLFTPLRNENKFESLWTGIAGLQIAVHDEYFPYKRTDKYSRIVQ